MQNFFGLGTLRISSEALGKHIAPMDFSEYLRKSDVSENSKVCYGLFYQNELQESLFVISVKVDEMYNMMTGQDMRWKWIMNGFFYGDVFVRLL